MKMKLQIAAYLGLALSLTACGKQEQKTMAVDKTGSAPPPGTAGGEMRHGKGVGIITALDADRGDVTLDHGAIAELQWPPMEMGFTAAPKLLAGIKAGDKVIFEIDWDGRAGTITKIAKAP